MSRDDMSESDPWKEILPVLPWHYGTVKWRPQVDGRWNCCSEMFSLDYWWIVSLCNTHGYVWKYILYSYMKGFGQVRFNFDDIWQRVNFDAQRASEQTGKLSGGPRVFDPRVRQIFRANVYPALCRHMTSLSHSELNIAKYQAQISHSSPQWWNLECIICEWIQSYLSTAFIFFYCIHYCVILDCV